MSDPRRHPPETAPADPHLERTDRELLRVLDADFARAAALAGEWLVCAPGCTDCCIGPFPITRLDGLRLRRGMLELERSEPARAAAVRARARAAAAALRPEFPGDPVSGRLADDPQRLDPFFERQRALACPALDPASGLCELYDQRPVSCRTYGPPVRFGEHAAPPCELCFRGAPPHEIERCRIEPDRGGLEQALLSRIGAAADEDWETLVAFALVDE